MGKQPPKVKVRTSKDALPRSRCKTAMPNVHRRILVTRSWWWEVKPERIPAGKATDFPPTNSEPRLRLPSASSAWLLAAALALFLIVDKLSSQGAVHLQPDLGGGCPCVPVPKAKRPEAGTLAGGQLPAAFSSGAATPRLGMATRHLGTLVEKGDLHPMTIKQFPEVPVAAQAATAFQIDLHDRRLHYVSALNAANYNVSLDEAGEEEREPEDSLPFLFTAIVIGTVMVQLSTLRRLQWMQQTVMLFIIGVSYSIVLDFFNLKELTHGFIGVSHNMWMSISPRLLLAVMLPILITGDSISIDTRVAKHVAGQCAYLAGPGVIICTFTLALFFQLYIPYNWSFVLCLVVSSILAATDPVAVVSLLKELGASPALTVQIQGESLLNDGTAMVLFTVAYDILRGQHYSFGDIVIFLVKSAVCALLLGAAIGFICFYWIRVASNRLDERSSLIQISITLSCAYWSWIIAESIFDCSGVLTTVSSALVLGDTMWPHIVSKEAMHHVWHTFEHIGNSVIFFVAGSLVGHNMLKIPFWDYVHLLVIYGVCTAVRAGMLFASVPVLNAVKHSCTEPITMADASVMCWGGLRGALGLALAIEVNVDCAGSHISTMDGQRVLFYVGGVALLTLVVNASTCPALVKWLRLNRPNGTKQMMMLNIHRHMSDFADDHAIPLSHVGNMLAEVESSITKAVDRATVENIEKITGPGVSKSSSNNSPGSVVRQGSSRTSIIEKIMSEPELSDCSVDEKCCCPRCCRKKGHSHKHMEVPKSCSLVRRLEVAQKRFRSIPKDYMEMLGLPSSQLATDELRELIELLELDGDWASPLQLKPINDVFLSMVRAKYWASIEADEFLQDEGQCMLDSISSALGKSSYKLADLQYIRKTLLKTFAEDAEIKSAILMDGGVKAPGQGVAFGMQESIASLSDGDAHEKKGCLKIISSIWYNTIVILVISLTTCISIGISILSNPALYQPPADGEMATVHCFFIFFIVDFVLRLCALKCETLSNSWSRLDALLTGLCLTGNILEILYATGTITDHILGSPLPEAIRALMVLQLLRVHQLFKSVRTIHRLRHLAAWTAPNPLAGRLQVVTILTAFTRAHFSSQQELIKYFGKRGKVGSGILARCIVESLTEVCDASYMAFRAGSLVNPATLNSLRTLRSCVHATEDLCRLVEDAHNCGAMSEQDADSVLHPLKSHLYNLRQMVHEAHEGSLPNDEQEHYVRDKPSYRWARSLESLSDRAQSDLAPTPRREDASVQTSWILGVLTPGNESGCKTLEEPNEDLNQLAKEGVEIKNCKECEYAADLSYCETWSVYTVDDLVPPLNPPGSGETASCQDPMAVDVHL